MVASGVGIAAAMPVLAWFINLGSWNFLQSGFFTDFYDAQARALFHGHWYVPPSVVQIEGFVVKGHTYMYYGPFPTLLRMPILLFTSSLDGRLTQLSMLLAMLVSLLCTARLAWKIRNLASFAPVSVKESVLVAFSIAVVGIGSVFVFLASVPIVYHEAEAWGAALAIAAFDALVGFLVRPSTRGIVMTGTFASLDLLTRGSVGLGPVAALALLAVLHGAVSVWRRGLFGGLRLPWRHDPGEGDPGAAVRMAWIGIPDVSTGPTRTISLAAAAVVPVALYAAVNYMKFGTLFSIPWTTQVARHYSPAVRAALAANNNSLLGLKFLPTAVVQFLRPDALRTSRLFPFLAFPPPATVIGHIVYEFRNPTSSVTSSMPAFALTGLVGLWSVFHPLRRSRHGLRRTPTGLTLLRVPILGAAVGIAGSLEIAYIAQRYLADWMPLLILAGLAGLAVLVQWARAMTPWRRRTVAIVGCVIALFGVLTNVSLTILYQRELNPFFPPVSARAQFVSLQQRIDQQLFGNPPQGVTIVQRLPKVEPAGSLVILGDCAALYQSNGLGWAAVEQSAAVGHYRLNVTFGALARPSHTYWPLVSTGEPGSGSFVAVRVIQRDEVRIEYLTQGPSETWVKGPVIRATPGHPSVVDVVLDPNNGNGDITLNGTLVSIGRDVRAPTHVMFGIDSIGGPTARTFAGEVERLATPTPVCDSLRHRLGAVGHPPQAGIHR